MLFESPMSSVDQADVFSSGLFSPIVSTVVFVVTWRPTDPLHLLTASPSTDLPEVDLMLAEVGEDWKFWSEGVGEVESTVSLPAGDASPNPVSPLRFWSLFHFILRFWNQILIWRSVSCRADAISMRRGRQR